MPGVAAIGLLPLKKLTLDFTADRFAPTQAAGPARNVRMVHRRSDASFSTREALERVKGIEPSS